MNAHAERFVGSIRHEALDSFIIIGYDQLYSLVKKYVAYFNRLRPHQGIEQVLSVTVCDPPSSFFVTRGSSREVTHPPVK
jgi:hypothetical protein